MQRRAKRIRTYRCFAYADHTLHGLCVLNENFDCASGLSQTVEEGVPTHQVVRDVDLGPRKSMKACIIVRNDRVHVHGVHRAGTRENPLWNGRMRTDDAFCPSEGI